MLNELKFFKAQALRKTSAFPKKSENEVNRLRLFINERYKAQKSGKTRYAEKKTRKEMIIEQVHVYRKKLEKTASMVKHLSFINLLMANIIVLNELSHMISIIDAFVMYGPGVMLPTYFIFTLLFSLPANMIVYFFGNNSRVGNLEFWHSMPLLSGFLIPVVVASLIASVTDLNYAGVAGYMMFSVLSNSTVWNECQTEPLSCVANLVKQNCTTWDGEQVGLKMFTAQFNAVDFLRDLTSLDTLLLGKNLTIIVEIVLLWLVLFWLVVGSNLLLSTVCWITFVLMTTMTMVGFCIAMVFGDGFYFTAENYWDFSCLQTVDFWVRSMLLAYEVSTPLQLITYSTICKSQINPTSSVLYVSLARLLFVTLFVNLVSICAGAIMKTFNVDNMQCMFLDGFSSIFGVIPHALFNRMHYSTLVIYFFIVMIWGLISAYLQFNSLAISFRYHNPEHQLYKVLGIVAACCIINVFLIDMIFYFINMRWHIILPRLLAAYLMCVFMMLYGNFRISTDYKFAFGKSLSHWWLICLDIFKLVSSYLTLAYVFFSLPNDYYLIENLTSSLIVVVPTIVGAIFKIGKYATKVGEYPLVPSVFWGEPDVDTRIARRNYNPKSELKYKGHYKCNHLCTHDLIALDEEQRMWNERMKHSFI